VAADSATAVPWFGKRWKSSAYVGRAFSVGITMSGEATELLERFTSWLRATANFSE
jgi:hypothetical protein